MHWIMPTMRRLLLGAAAAAICVATAGGQSILGPPSEANHFIETPNGWVHPKTPWGEPDIQATLNMMQAAGVPLERCASSQRFGGPPCDMSKPWWTDEEYDQRVAAARGRGDLGRQLIEQGNFGRALLSGVTDPSTPQRQTSLIVDPPNGLLPDLTAEGKRRALQMGSSWALPGEDPVYEEALDFDFWDNCRSRGMPSSMMPYRYNGGFRIWQAPGVVVFDLEMIHDARVIFTDGRPSLSPAIKQYMGESRGRWEGNTLVVETTNYKEGPPMINLAVVGSPPGNRFPVSDSMETTERITRVNDDMWLYAITTEDPVILTRPFTVRYPMRHDATYEWWEYGCHEGNTIVPNYVTTNRHERANPPAEPSTPVQAPADVANALAGRWSGRPRVATVDYDMFLEFTTKPDGMVQGKLIGTNLKTFRGRVQPNIDKPLRDLTINDRRLNFQLPNTQPWTFAGELSADGSSLTGTLNSAQGGVPVTFRRTK
jgi:hypothetical protein